MGGLDDPTKSVLEIALPALVGFNAGVSFKQLAYS